MRSQYEPVCDKKMSSLRELLEGLNAWLYKPGMRSSVRPASAQ
jgi:hypothetical protein